MEISDPIEDANTGSTDISLVLVLTLQKQLLNFPSARIKTFYPDPFRNQSF